MANEASTLSKTINKVRKQKPKAVSKTVKANPSKNQLDAKRPTTGLSTDKKTAQVDTKRQLKTRRRCMRSRIPRGTGFDQQLLRELRTSQPDMETDPAPA